MAKKMKHIIKLHWVEKNRIKKLYLEGFTGVELSIMWNVPVWYVNVLTMRLRKPERI